MSVGVIAALRVVAAFFVFYDARRRGWRLATALIWAVAGAYLPIVVLPLYLLARSVVIVSRFQQPQKPPSVVLCPRCGFENPGGASVCQKCQNQLTLS